MVLLNAQKKPTTLGNAKTGGIFWNLLLTLGLRMYAIDFLKINYDLQFVFLYSCFVGDLKGKFESTKTQQNVGGGRGGWF